MNSKQIFNRLNSELLRRLIPEKTEPIYCNSVLDPNDKIFKKSFEQIIKEVISEKSTC